jgi:hypothetical protein
MTIPDGMFALTDLQSNTYYFPVPEYGYKSTIDFPWDIDILDTGNHVTFDAGYLYDKYRCDFDLLLTPTQQTQLNALVKNTGRAVNTLTMTMNATCGFFPFTPVNGDGGPFTVALAIVKSEVLIEEPFRYFRVSCSVWNMGSFPAYSLPAQIAEGSLYMCGISNLRFPTTWFDPTEDNGILHDITENGAIDFIDRGVSAASWHTDMNFTWGTGNTAAFLQALLNVNVRSTYFNFSTQPYHYAFGNDKGSQGNYMIKLIQDSIEFTHDTFNQFTFKLSTEYVSQS